MNKTVPTTEKVMVALFADFRGFSHMFDVLPAHKVYKFTNRYFQTAAEIIERYRGVLDNIVGDGLVAIWGKDQVVQKAPFYAVRSALEMRMALLRQNIQYKWESHFPLEIGVGVAMGKSLHCMVGPRNKPIDTVFGKPVILASRLADIAKNNQIYIDNEVAESITRWAKLEKLSKTTIRGFKGTFTIYKIEGMMDFHLKNNERRKSSAIRFVVPEIAAIVFKENGLRKPAILRNLSSSGAGIEIVQKEDAPIRKNDEISLDLKRFDFPNLNSLDGKIVQINTISEESEEVRCLSRVGISFHNLEPDKRRVLERFNIA
ncbi:MAG: PilZ domain-containing protein [Spirochaetes bacterium]|nr:PilZ domain-containing protein [Spirochaetota bacterium]